MNIDDRIKAFIKDYYFPYSDDDLKELGTIFEKITKILYGNNDLDCLEETEIIFLNKKDFLAYTDANLIILYINYVKEGLNIGRAKEKINLLLENVVVDIRKIDEEWKNINVCNKILQDSKKINDMNENEIRSLVNMIINSNISDSLKEDFLINISLNINHFAK